ncbi:MAG TPA: ABC transporter permease, partial [Bryobacteraceae bacterium]|nr:ABC transporter permease [Bryobacteraceae bacterium]
MPRKPPFPALLLLRFWLSNASYEAIAGDLCEEYQAGDHSAGWFWRQVFSTLRVHWRPAPDWNDIRPAARRENLLSSCLRDIAYSARGLARAPGFTLVAIAAIALGVGANTGIFTLLNALALRPLPVEDGARIVTPYQSIEGLKTRNIRGSPDLFSYPEYQQYRQATQSLAGLAAYVPFVESALTGKRSGLVTGELVTCNYFSVLGRPPGIGRAFTESECRRSGASAVVLSDAAWRSKFGADPSIVGETITLNRHAFTVVGVGPNGFAGTFLLAADFWTPLSSQPALLPQVDWHDSNLSWLCLLGRLNPGVSASQAQAELQIVAHRIDTSQPGRRTTLRADVASLVSEPRVRKNLLYGSTVLLAGVSLILLIACANVANLLLARGAHRSRELAIRLSLGASRGRIVRQLLTESLLLSVAGGVVGVLMAHITFGGFFTWMGAHLPSSIPPLAIDLSIDWRIWTYGFLVSVATGV